MEQLILECVGGPLDGETWAQGAIEKRKFKSGRYVQGLWPTERDELDIWLWVPAD